MRRKGGDSPTREASRLGTQGRCEEAEQEGSMCVRLPPSGRHALIVLNPPASPAIRPFEQWSEEQMAVGGEQERLESSEPHPAPQFLATGARRPDPSPVRQFPPTSGVDENVG